MTRSHRRLRRATAALAVFAAVPAFAQSVVSFGDSLSDTGNLFAVTGRTTPPSPPYFEGRFSNGPVFTELLAGPMQLAGAAGLAGLPVDPARSRNYAFGGAVSDRSQDPTPPGVPLQIDLFQAQGGTFRSGDLVTLYAGANDLRDGLATGSPAVIQSTTLGAASNVAASADRLAALGAPTLVVLGLPDLGATPEARANPSILARPTASAATSAFNGALSAGLFAAADRNPDTTIHFVDVQPALAEVLADPGRFGFTNVSEACLAVAACRTAPADVQNDFLFFDTIHPTARGHRLLADLVTDHLTAGERAADAGSLSEIGFADRLAGEDAVRERARRLLAATDGIAQGADVIDPAIAAPYWGGAYVSLEGASFDRDSGGGVSGYDYDGGTVRAGADYRLTDRFLLGGAVSFMRGEIDDARLTYDTQSFSADLYGTAVYGPAHVTLSGGVAHVDFEDLRRRTAVPGIVNRGGNTDGFAANIGLEAGYGFELGALRATPTLGLSYVRFDVDGFSEDGSGAEIVYGGYDRDVLYGAANLHLAYETVLAGRRAELTGRIGYEDALSDGGDDGIASSIAGSPAGPSFASFDDVPGRGFILGAGAEVNLTERLGLGGRYSVGFGDAVEVSHIGSATLSFRF